MPIGILGSLVVCTLLYVIVGFIITGIVPYDMLNVPDPIAVGVDKIGLKWLAPIIKLGAILGLSSVILVTLLAQTRILYTMAKDGLLPRSAAIVHPHFRAALDALPPPVRATVKPARRPCGAVADRTRRRTGQHRHPSGVCDRLHRSTHITGGATGPAASVQDARGVVRRAGRGSILSLSDVLPAGRDVGASGLFARDRSCDLFPLRRSS